ncbi:hypothetical protein KR093_000414, partial [Drosophila rubida]
TDLQMPGKNCKNIQQHRGRRRQRHGHRGAGAGGGFVGIFWSINLAILICLAQSTNAVPTDNNSAAQSSTVVMAAVTPSSISSTSSSINSSGSSTESQLEQQQPQGQCLLDGLWVAETTVHCEKQASCRAIQRTGHCCPDYKCDCEKDGKTYANGYKLVDPDTPCTVCYCKGGEIVCSSVTCFRRDDCMPKYVPGRCCPEYDNCPILDNNPTLGETSSAPSPPTTASPVAPAAPPAGFNWNITIKEITKPTEIRITDNQKAKPIFTRKVHSTEAPTAVAASSSSSTTTTTTTTTATPATVTTAAETTATTATAIEAAATPTSSAALSQDTNPKALPVNGSSGESLKLVASVSYKDQQQQQPLVSYNADDPSKVNIKREYTTEGADLSAYALSSGFIQNGFRDALVDNGAAAAELEPETAGSDNIYHIISTTEGPSGSSSSTERQLSSEATPTQSELSSTYGYYENSTAALEQLSTEGVPASSSEAPLARSTQSLHHMDEEDVPQVESNPAYPSLPEDDFSLRDVNFPLVELEDIVEADNKDEQRSIVSPFERDNKRHKLVTDAPETNGSGSGSGSGSGDLELYQPLPAPSEQLQAQVPLIYSAEDSSAELSKIRRTHSEQHETSGELETGSGSGSGELREPTTPRSHYAPEQDIDELGSGALLPRSTLQDPKADAESLKLNESQEQAAADAGKATARAEKSFVELSSIGAGGAALRPDRLYLQRIY